MKPRQMIEPIVPDCAAAFDSASELEVELSPAEAAHIAHAVDGRRAEFMTARRCAKEALAALGVVSHEIGVGERGEPQWPEGTLGSITHCTGYRGSVVARARDLAALGIDAERNAPLPPNLVQTIGRQKERQALRHLARRQPAVAWDRLLFCAKEAIYKATFPLAKRRLGYMDAEVEFRMDGTFRISRLARYAHDARPSKDFVGRWLLLDGLLLTTVVMHHDDRDDASSS